MKYSLGITSEKPYADRRFSRIKGGWRGDLEPNIARELATLCQTPGIPIEWVYFVFNLSRRMRTKLAAIVASHEVAAEAAENFVSMTVEDGLAMIRVMENAHTYQGAIPLAASLALQADRRLDVDRAAEFAVHPQKVHHWRTHQVFDPLTGRRIIRRRGNPKLILPF